MTIPQEVRSESFQSILPGVADRKWRIVALLKDHLDGLTAWELHAILGGFIHGLRPRLTELTEDGIVKPAGKRRSKQTGSRETIWVLK